MKYLKIALGMILVCTLAFIACEKERDGHILSEDVGTFDTQDLPEDIDPDLAKFIRNGSKVVRKHSPETSDVNYPRSEDGVTYLAVGDNANKRSQFVNAQISHGLYSQYTWYPQSGYKAKYEYKTASGWASAHPGSAWLYGDVSIALTFDDFCRDDRQYIRVTSAVTNLACRHQRIIVTNSQCGNYGTYIDYDLHTQTAGWVNYWNFKANPSQQYCWNWNFTQQGSGCFPSTNPGCTL